MSPLTATADPDVPDDRDVLDFVTKMLYNQLIFTLLTEESSPTLDIVLREVIKIRHPALATASKSHAASATATASATSSFSSSLIERSSDATSYELLTLVKSRLLCLCRLILQNLTIPVKKGAVYRDLAPLLQVELMQMSHMIQETATVDHLVETTYLKCQESFRDYLHWLKTHLNDYLIPHKNNFDRKLSFEFLIRAQLMDADRKMIRTKKALQVCPDREEAKKRLDRFKEMQDKVSSLTRKISESEERLIKFRSLDARLVKKLTQVYDELVEKKWAAEQLGCLSFADTSAFE